MRTITTVIIITMLFIACERVEVPGNSDAATADIADAGPIDAGSVQPPPGQSEPVEIPCELQDDYTETRRAEDGTLVGRLTYAQAVWGSESPPARPYTCEYFDFRNDPPACPDVYECITVGTPRQPRCQASLWALSDDGEWYVHCGLKQEQDPDGDGQITVTGSMAAYVLVDPSLP